MIPEERAVQIVIAFNDEPPGSPRRSPPLAAMIAKAIREAVLEEREGCARAAEAWAENYPANIFPAHGTSPDAISGTMGRHSANMIAEDIRSRGKP